MNKNTVIDECLKVIPHRFELVVLASQRARLLYLGAPSVLEDTEKSRINLALREIAEGACTRKSIIQSFEASIEIFEEEDIAPSQDIVTKNIKDGMSYDDFNIDDDAFEQD